MKSLPNILTVLRIFLALVFVVVMFQKGYLLATIIFLVASLTDLCDGYYARKHNLTTDFGKLMDPIADKFLILTAFFVFMQMNIIATWMFVIIFLREVLITLWRLLAISRGQVMIAEKAGKIKTTLQMVVISLILLCLVFTQLRILSGSYNYFFIGINWLMLAVVVVTLASGISYVWNNKKLLHV